MSRHSDHYYMLLAYRVRSLSNHDERQVGAVISDSKTGDILLVGPNRLAPMFVSEHSQRRIYPNHKEWDIHAETGLVLEAAKRGIKLEGKTIHVTRMCCPMCAKMLAGAGVKRVVVPQDQYDRHDRARRDLLKLLKAETLDEAIHKLKELKILSRALQTISQNSEMQTVITFKRAGIVTKAMQDDPMAHVVSQGITNLGLDEDKKKRLNRQYQIALKIREPDARTENYYDTASVTNHPIVKCICSAARTGTKLLGQPLDLAHLPPGRVMLFAIMAGVGKIKINKMPSKMPTYENMPDLGARIPEFKRYGYDLSRAITMLEERDVPHIPKSQPKRRSRRVRLLGL